MSDSILSMNVNPSKHCKIFINDENSQQNIANICKIYDVNDFNSEMKIIKNQFNQNLFNILHINVRSLLKSDDIYDFLRELNFEIDVLAISESWLNDSNENLININGYVFKGKHRRIKHGGGVGFYIKNNLDYKIRDDITSIKNEFEFLVLEIINRPITKIVLIIVTYRPPTYDVNSFIECLDDILLVANHENKLIIVAGDFNIDLSESNNNNNKFNFLQLMNSYSLQQTITISTRVECNRQSIIDIFTNIPENILVSGVISHCLSDHQPVFSSINLSKKMFMFPEKRNAPSVKFSYSTNRINNLNQRLSQVNWQVVYESANIEKAFKLL
ncbi:hypothetical protein HELRODRAFT_168624 [Helobdella robusta]|uniref:Endonuclease/exonuclease/phosphatase domain-containing protein n=1 Tax=Helobdella robusta TaxID=6412 RepID=T1F0T0_HELRO|nr:hypothetical protein HELRODRAFT_168624 [Helobdella robusta]ESO09612.1 hypothetical protein HELRODRAFT_168624 [Helobdella robusta]